MEPAPPPHVPAAGPGASPRGFRSARSSHGAHAGRWGAPGSASRPRTSRAPSRCGQRGRTAARGLPSGVASGTRRTPGTRGFACRRTGLCWPHGSLQPATRSRRAARRRAPGRQRLKLRSAPRPSRPPPPPPPALPCGSRVASPPPPPPGRCRHPSGSRDGLPPLVRGRHLPPGRGAALHAPPWTRLARRFCLASGGSDPLRQSQTSSQ